MSRSMHGPWIKNCMLGMLAGEESYSTHQTRCVQVIAVKVDARVLLISDTEIAINAFLTEECFNELLEIYPIETIKQSQINLSEFYFSTVSQAAGNMDMEFLRKLGICPPFALHCFKVDYLGASDSTTIGKPSDVNQSNALISELRKFKYAELLDRLAERQYPLPRLLKTLPDWEGTFIVDPTAAPADQPLQSADFTEPELQTRIIEAIDSFDIRHTLEVLPALLMDEAGNLGETGESQGSAVPRLVPTTRSQNQSNSNNNSNGKKKSKGKESASKNATTNAKNKTSTTTTTSSHPNTYTQEATAGWSETMREDDEYDHYLSAIPINHSNTQNNAHTNGYAHTWDPLGDSQLSPEAEHTLHNSVNKNKVNDFSYPDSDSDQENQKNGADDMEILPRETPTSTQFNTRHINNNNKDVYHRLDTGTQNSQMDEHMLFSQELPLTSAITEIVETRATRSTASSVSVTSKKRVSTEGSLQLTGSSTTTTTSHTSSTNSITFNTTIPLFTASPPLAQRSQHSTQSSGSDKSGHHTTSTLSTLAGVYLLQSSQSPQSVSTHGSAQSKNSAVSKNIQNTAVAPSAQQLQQASQAEPITSPVEDRPYRPHNFINQYDSYKKQHSTNEDSNSDGESSDNSSSDGMPKGIRVVPLTPLQMAHNTTNHTTTTTHAHPTINYSVQYLQEQRYITQPSQHDLSYSAASGNLTGNSVSDFTISQGEEEVLEIANTTVPTKPNTTNSIGMSNSGTSSNSAVKSSAVKYSTQSTVQIVMGPPTTVRTPLPLPNTTNTHTANSSATFTNTNHTSNTQSTPSNLTTSHTNINSTLSSGVKTSSHPTETQSYQSPSQSSQNAPIVMINNNTSQGNSMVRKGAPVVMTRYKLREKEEVKELEQAELLVGQQVNKKFNRDFYLGNVQTYDAESKLFHIVYEDGDEEDMILREVNKWLYRPDVQQLSSRKTRRTDPVITTITTTTTPASMATSVTTGVAIPTARASALRTIPEGEMSGGEESESDLTQPQFVTQPDLTQSVVVAPSTRVGTRSRMSSTEALLYSQTTDSEMEGTPAVHTRNKPTTSTTNTNNINSSTTTRGIAGMSIEDARDTPGLKRLAGELLDGESTRKAPRMNGTSVATTINKATDAASDSSSGSSSSSNHGTSSATTTTAPTQPTAVAPAPATLTAQEVQHLTDVQLLDYFNTLVLPAGFVVPPVSDYGYNIYTMLRALPGYLHDIQAAAASHKKGAHKKAVHKVASPLKYAPLTLKTTRSGAIPSYAAASTTTHPTSTSTTNKRNAAQTNATSVPTSSTTAATTANAMPTVLAPVVSVADLTDAEIKQQYPNAADARRIRMQRAVERSQRKK